MVKKEVEMFDVRRAEEFKAGVVTYLEAMLRAQVSTSLSRPVLCRCPKKGIVNCMPFAMPSERNRFILRNWFPLMVRLLRCK